MVLFVDLHLWKWMGIETEGDALGFVISKPSSVAGSTGIMIRKGKHNLSNLHCLSIIFSWMYRIYRIFIVYPCVLFSKVVNHQNFA